MKVGIMSMQRVINYGSFLQAYSLKKNIEALGNQVEFIDYEIGKVLVKDKPTRRYEKIKVFFIKVYQRVVRPYKIKTAILTENFGKLNQLDELFKEDFFPLLPITEEKNQCSDLDVLVIGSDEVFNCLQTNPKVGYSSQLFGADNNAEKVISYAASFGNTTYSGLKKYGIEKEIGGLLKKFHKISVRDKNSGNIVQTLIKEAPEYHLDPVFIYDYSEKMPKNVNLKNYIVVYSYACRISKKEAKEILQFAKQNNKEIVCLGGPQLYLSNYYVDSPFTILAYIKHADYIVTDTFHGTVFSIKFNKKFAVVIRGGHEEKYGNSEKLADLLERFHLESRSVHNIKELGRILLTDIDYKEINETIEFEKEKSIKYLQTAIGNS